MSFEEVKEVRVYLKIKGQDGVPALEVELDSLVSLLQCIASVLKSGQVEFEKREVPVKRWIPPEIPKIEEGENH